MILVAGYCRVSTASEDQANSFQAQKRYFREYIKLHPDWDLYEIYADEGITGTSTKKRIQFNRMIRDAQDRKFSLIITKEVSRFSRNILDTIAYTRQLKGLGVSVRFLNDGIDTSDSDAELRLSIMATIAQEESRRTSSRVTWGQTRQMERGIVFGPSMLGYDVKNGAISVNREGAGLVRLIFYQYTRERMSTTEIARYLTNHGYRSFKGNTQWKPNGVVKILKNEKYVGDLVQKKSYTPDYLTHEKKTNRGQVPLVTIENHHEPIISRKIWNQAQCRLRENNKHQKEYWGHSDRYTFSGKIKCGECGRAFVGRWKYLRDGSKIRRWSCGNAGCRVGKLLREDDALEMMKAALKNLPFGLDSSIAAVLQWVENRSGSRDFDNTPELESEMIRVENKKEKAVDSYFDGIISKEEMVALKSEYDRQLESLRIRIQERNQFQPDTSALKSELKAIAEGDKVSEAFFKTILKSITVFQDRHMELRLKGMDRVFCFEETQI